MIRVDELSKKTISDKFIAYAKINLALDVTGRLDNGYHLVKMIMENVSIYDELEIRCSDNAGIRMTCDKEGLSCGDDNLVIKAAKALLTEAGYISDGVCDIGVDIKLNKNIPMAAGMAGGSTDAAAVLNGLNQMLDIGFDKEKLCEIGVKLGADIPYCILGGSYLAEGIGEKLTKISNPPKAHLAIIKPGIDVSTKFVYEHIDNNSKDIIHPDVDGMLDAFEKSDLQGVCSRLGNVLRDVTVPAYPIVLELEEYLLNHGAMGALMSGSGPTVFALYEDEEKCSFAIESAKKDYPDMFIQKAEFVL